MKSVKWSTVAVAAMLVALVAGQVLAQDWPQWRGPERSGKATGFKAPETWPKALSQKWKVTVGAGNSSPVLVGDKLYVFARQEGDEVTLCLNAADGKELWRDKNAVAAITGPAARAHSGPRATPAVAEGKVVTLGVSGVLTCLNAADGKVVWRKDEIKGAPQFFTSSSPIIVDGLAIAQLGPQGTGAIVAYELASGKEKWKCADQGAAYASPVLATIEGIKQIITLTDSSVVGIGVADGKLLWKAPFGVSGRGYNAATPVVDGSTVFVSGIGRGTKALKIEKKEAGLEAKELWSNPLAVQFCSPVVKDGLVYALSNKGNLFCLNAADGQTAWTVEAPMGSGGFGVMLDAGTAVLALPNNSELVAFKADGKAFTELARYKLAASPTIACPILTGNRVFAKDQDSLILWTLE